MFQNPSMIKLIYYNHIKSYVFSLSLFVAIGAVVGGIVGFAILVVIIVVVVIIAAVTCS